MLSAQIEADPDTETERILASDNFARYIIPDEDFGDGKHTVFAPFFGQCTPHSPIGDTLER